MSTAVSQFCFVPKAAEISRSDARDVCAGGGWSMTADGSATTRPRHRGRVLHAGARFRAQAAAAFAIRAGVRHWSKRGGSTIRSMHGNGTRNEPAVAFSLRGFAAPRRVREDCTAPPHQENLAREIGWWPLADQPIRCGDGLRGPALPTCPILSTSEVCPDLSARAT